MKSATKTVTIYCETPPSEHITAIITLLLQSLLCQQWPYNKTQQPCSDCSLDGD